MKGFSWIYSMSVLYIVSTVIKTEALLLAIGLFAAVAGSYFMHQET